MKKIFKTILKTVLASCIIFTVACVISLLLNTVHHFVPVLYWSIGVVMLLLLGYFIVRVTEK